MMSRRTPVLAMVWVLAMAVLGVQAADFTISTASGDVQAGKAKDTLAAVAVGAAFKGATVLQTGPDGQVAASIDEKNGFRLHPDTRLKADIGGKASRVTLEKGAVTSTLDAWPAGKAYEVATPAGRVVARGTTFTVAYVLGPDGQRVATVDVAQGEVEFVTPEGSVPSLAANAGMTLSRTVGQESTMLTVTAKDAPLTLVLGDRHRITVAAGSTVRVAVPLRYIDRFVAVAVDSGSATVGSQALSAGSQPVYVAGAAVIPNADASALMAAVPAESSAFAQSQLPGLTDEQRTALLEAQRLGAQAIVAAVTDAGVLERKPLLPFVPGDRLFATPLSPSGTP